MVTLHGKKIRQGDIVWHSRMGFLKVGNINNDQRNNYTIRLEIGSTFTSDGKVTINDMYPTLFWKEQILDLSQPLPELEVDTKMLVWNAIGNKVRRYFSHFDKDGDIRVFVHGKTSFTADGDVTTFNNWEVYKDDLKEEKCKS